MNQRTLQQNKSIWLYYQILADELNDSGYDPHANFQSMEIEEHCTWFGTEWDGDRIQNCGQPTIGAGIFCELGNSHEDCMYHSLCEKHAIGHEQVKVKYITA